MRTRQSFVQPADIHALVQASTSAPSIHNSQPWRFEWDGQALSLIADTSRTMAIVDPQGRELVISCGAALFNLRMAARKLGMGVSVDAVPASGDPRLLATVRFCPGDPASASERLLFAAMNRRHTYRGPFAARPLPPELAVRLQQAAHGEGAALLYVLEPGQRGRVLHLARSAERDLAADLRVRAEIEAWTPNTGSRRRDGIPAFAYGPASNGDNRDELPHRDFDLERGLGEMSTAPIRAGGIAVLASERDTVESWLAAGQGLQRVLVTAAMHDVFAALHSQVIEVPNLRLELQRELCTSLVPHLLLRFGYPLEEPPVTPRRPVSDVLDLTIPEH